MKKKSLLFIILSFMAFIFSFTIFDKIMLYKYKKDMHDYFNDDIDDLYIDNGLENESITI